MDEFKYDFEFWRIRILQNSVPDPVLDVTNFEVSESVFRSFEAALDRGDTTAARNEINSLIAEYDPFLVPTMSLSSTSFGLDTINDAVLSSFRVSAASSSTSAASCRYPPIPPLPPNYTKLITPPRKCDEILYMAFMKRANLCIKSKEFMQAKRDVERAILLLPKCVEAYDLLSEIERHRLQFGKMVVALRLALLLDPENECIKKKMKKIRGKDRVHDDVNSLDGSHEELQEIQRQAGLDLELPLPRVVENLMAGNVDALKEQWNPEMMHIKHGKVKNPLIHFPILGLQRRKPLLSNGDVDEQGRKKMVVRQKAIIDFLFDHGARLDKKDYAGYTAVMHASGHTPQPELLEHLLSKGADPNIRSCYGCTALLNATLFQNVREIEILLRYGADPFIADNSGGVPIKMAENFRQVIALFHRDLYPKIPARVCAGCGGLGAKRCVNCRVVHYCSKKCQKGEWRSHKSRCEELRRGHMRVALSSDKMRTNFVNTPDLASITVKNIVNADIPWYEPKAARPVAVKELKTKDLFAAYNEAWKNDGQMLVKIQTVRRVPAGRKFPCPNGSMEIDPNGHMMVYNESRQFQCMLDPNKLDAQKLIAILKEKGVAGKGYFWAFMEEEKREITVITDPMHPAQPW